MPVEISWQQESGQNETMNFYYGLNFRAKVTKEEKFTVKYDYEVIKKIFNDNFEFREFMESK